MRQEKDVREVMSGEIDMVITADDGKPREPWESRDRLQQKQENLVHYGSTKVKDWNHQSLPVHRKSSARRYNGRAHLL